MSPGSPVWLGFYCRQMTKDSGVPCFCHSFDGINGNKKPQRLAPVEVFHVA